MYFWKCWRDTRSFFVVAVIIAAVMMPVAAAVCKGTGLLEDFGPSAFLSTFGLLGMVTALGVGAVGASEEFADKTVYFLFTKPRSRAYFVWAGWAVGCFEVLLISLVNLAVGWAVLARHATNPANSGLFGSITAHQIVSNFILFVYVYCASYALTALLRNGLKGIGASMVFVFGFPLFAVAIRWRWKIALPVPVDRIGTLPLVSSDLIWMIIALLFVFTAQLIVERAEIR